MKALFFDTEWANNKNKSICQISFIEVDLSTLEILNTFNKYVNPNDDYDRFCIAVHNITANDTCNCVTFDVIWDEIKDYFDNRIIIGHNVCSADLDALVKNLNRYNLAIPNFDYIDTYEIAKKLINPNLIANYKQSTIADYFNCSAGKKHDAYYDSLTNYNIFECFINFYSLRYNRYIKKYTKEVNHEFCYFISQKDFIRELKILFGVLQGIEMDKVINNKEVLFLKQWKDKFKGKSEGEEFVEILEKILDDNIVTKTEINILNKLILDEIVEYYSAEETQALLILEGIINGITADNKINKEELNSLQNWLYHNQYLKGNYPYDKILYTVNNTLEDGIISEDELENLVNVFNEFFSPIKELKKQVIEFKDKKFVLTGDFKFGTRKEVTNYIENKGGIVKSGVSSKIDYVVIGNLGSTEYSYGTYGSKVKKALELNKIILKEEDMFN